MSIAKRTEKRAIIRAVPRGILKIVASADSADWVAIEAGRPVDASNFPVRKLRGRAFVVTDERLIAAGLAQRVVEPLTEAGITVELFRGGEPEPAIATAVAAADAATRFEPDCVVGLGGGSNMDLAKFTAVLLT